MKSHYAIALLLASFLVGCGGGSNTPAPVNAPPSIGAIADQTATANQQSRPIPFTITDERINGVTVSAVSDNQSVLPDHGLSLVGNGVNRTITVTPLVDVLGDAFVTITATDAEGLASSLSFLVVLEPEERSMQTFTREGFIADADAEPELVNAVEFVQDAELDDFADLF